MELSVFKYQSPEGEQMDEVTTVEIDGEIWFVGSQVCKVLGITTAANAIKRLYDDDKLLCTLYISGQRRKVSLISESGLYALIFTSRKESAKQFQRWVTKEVLPSIRKKGSYGINDRSGLPNFVIRYQDNLHRIGWNYFSVIGELFLTLYQELEKTGYQIPEKGIDGQLIMPDISAGRMFADYLKRTNSEFYGTHKFYKHTFPDARRDVKARMYPLKASPTFREFICLDWIPNNAHRYFKERDPAALDYLPKLITRINMGNLQLN